MLLKRSWCLFALIALWLLFPSGNHAQPPGSHALIKHAIDERRLVTLSGNTRRQASALNDRGPAPGNLHLDMFLQLKRSPERELAAKQFVESLTDKSSPNFHHWITAAEYGRRFGASAEDIATVSRWLESHGFTVNGVLANNMVIDFSGDAAHIRDAFHTEIHYLDIEGKRHFANMSDPRIPEALFPAVAGVVSMSDIMPSPMWVPKMDYTVSSSTYPVVPGDLATIYNLNPAFAGGFTGQGQTVVVLEDTDLYSGTGDWNTFRKTFGLNKYTSGTLTQSHPAPGPGGSACLDPGVNGDDAEAAIDVEWAAAAAPNAAIVMAACADTTNFGGFIALQNLLANGGPVPGIVSISYGESETDSGASGNLYITTLFQTAAAAGVSVFVSAGDEAAAETDHRSEVAIHGVSVSSYSATPYNVAVGGTDFGDTAAAATTSFWNATNGTYFDSAKSYVPEIPWNESCASQVLANYHGFATSYGPSGYCNTTYNRLTGVGGSGGPSGCATGAPAVSGVVGGSCAGYPKPSWQSVYGNPSDGVRDIPDLSLFAAAGLWGHYYVFCITDGASCSGAPSSWAGAGGTSFAAPIMAGIQALVNQALGRTNVGNPNPVYYQIAQAEYSTAGGLAACNSSTNPGSSCAFYDVTLGDMVLPCAGIYNCFMGGGGIGVLSTSDSAYQPAYGTTPGWDFATGIGTVNAYALIEAYVASIVPSAPPPAPALASPANNAAGVQLAPALVWNAAVGAASYDVYFGTATQPPQVSSTTNLTYAPGSLDPATTYYWSIGARNSLGATPSAVWSFTTSCVSALSLSGAGFAAAGGSGSIPVTATSGCAWTAVSNVSWISITAGASGSGNGTVSYMVAADPGAQRTGAITIAGQAFTVTQGGIDPVISTLAGGSMPATTANGPQLSIPLALNVAVDSAGNAYFASGLQNAVYKADPNGVVTRIAGTGVSGFSGDGGPALNALLSNPSAVAVDAQGNVYIADSVNRRIRKVDTSGNITTAAGNGICCTPTGDTGPATNAQVGTPYGIAVDSSGNLYFSDISNHIVRKVNGAGIITTVAGNGSSGYSGDSGPATSAKLYYPYGLAPDSNGNLFIADSYNQRIRQVDTNGIITTVAGNGTCCYSGDGTAATNARLAYPFGVAVDASGVLYIADTSNERIRKVSASGIITTVAGNGNFGFAGDNGGALNAQFRSPEGVALDANGNLYICDTANNRIRTVNSNGMIRTLAGGGLNDGGPAVFGSLNYPSGIARDNSGNTYIADTYNNRVRRVSPDGAIATVAGNGNSGYSGDFSAAANAQLNAPQGLALDSSGNLYIADANNHRVRRVDPSGIITTAAGNGVCCSATGDGGAATSAGIGTPYGLAVDSSGNLYLTDALNNLVRMVDANGNISTVAGNGVQGFSGDNGPATSARLNVPHGIAVDTAGNLFIADTDNERIRKVDTSGTITTIAGNGSLGFGGDGGAPTRALLAYPDGVAVDAGGNLYIADTSNERIRLVANGAINTIAGNGSYGYAGDGGLANAATFRYPYAIAADSSGYLVVADQSNNAVRLLTPAGAQPVLSIQSNHSASFTRGQSGAVYTLTVTNAPNAGATNGAVTVTELAPHYLTVVSLGGVGWTCAVTPAATCTRSDALSGGASYPAITVTVNVSSSTPAQITNQATVSGGGTGSVTGAEDLTLVSPPVPGSQAVPPEHRRR